MNFDSQTRQPCIVQPAAPPDPRCLDPNFSLANPALCGAVSALIIRPSVAMLCELESIQFRVFEYVNLTEIEVTDQCVFGTSNVNVFPIGVNGGAGTALTTGFVTITATKDNKVARATVISMGAACCDDVNGASAIVVDSSMSMSTDFDGGVGGDYPSRLAYAKAVAKAFASNLLTVDNVPKDAIKVWSLADEIVDETDAYLTSSAALQTAIDGIAQSLTETNLLLALTTAADDLIATVADRRILLIVSDGEHTTDTERQAIIDAARDFKTAGGIIITIGVRANGNGYDLLERIATLGFFLNAMATNEADVIAWLAFWKDLLCVGTCIPEGDTFVNLPQLDYSSFANWEVLDGQVHLLGPGLLDLQPGNGLYLDMAGGSPATIRTIDSFDLDPDCTVRVSFKLAGNQRVAIAGQSVKVYLRDVTAVDGDPNLFETIVSLDYAQEFQTFAFAFTPIAAVTARLYFEQLYTGTAPVMGNLLDSVKLECSTSGEVYLEDNFDDENQTYIPPRCGPSAAIEETDDPTVAASVEWLGGIGPSLFALYKYTYGYSWVTAQGETAVSPLQTFLPDVPEKDAESRRIGIPVPPDSVTSVRMWRSLGESHIIRFTGAGTGAANGDYIRASSTHWDQDGGTHYLEFDGSTWRLFDSLDTDLYGCDDNDFPTGPWTVLLGAGPAPTAALVYDPDATESEMYLLAEFDPSEVTYTDVESREDFEARHEASVTPPTVNTTAAAQGAFGVGYEYCCDYDYAAGGNLVPAMTDNVTPSGEATQSGSQSNPTNPFFAFDQDPTTYWDGLRELDGDGNYVDPPWIAYEFEDLVTISSYSIQASDLPLPTALNSPGRWELQGSNDGILWTTLDAVNGSFNQLASDWAPGETRSFDIDSPAAYRFYRLYILAPTVSSGVGTSKNVNIAEFKLFGDIAFTDECEDCLDDPGAQLPDAEPTLDVEGEIEPITTYTSTKNACFRCSDGFLSLSTANVSFTTLTGLAAGEGPWSQIVQLTDPTQIVGHYELSPYEPETGLCGPKDFKLQGTNDEGAATDDAGTVWVTLDEQVGQEWAGLTNIYYLQNQSTAYKYYRLLITAFSCGADEVDAAFDSLTESFLHTKGAAQVCIGATEESQVSQAHADQLAFASAAQGAADAYMANNTCAQFWNRTVAYTASCEADDTGTGENVTMSASYTSLISESHALQVAERIAKAAAVAALDCT